MTVEELPLLELFTKLRQAGLPLGVDEYQLLLRALQAGFGIPDRAALARLCRTLWVKSADEGHLFDYHFEQVMASIAVPPLPDTMRQPTPGSQNDDVRRRTKPLIARDLALGVAFILGIVTILFVAILNRWIIFPPIKNSTPQDPTIGNLALIIIGALLFIAVLMIAYIVFMQIIKLNAKRSDRNSPSQPKPIKPRSAVSSELTPKVEDEVQVVKAVRQTTRRKAEVTYNRFIETNEYFPVTRRQMKQSWRYLRRLIREGPATELDVEATINQIGRQGLLLEPVLVPRRVNRTELLLLIDRDGSMVPFHNLSNRLAETALRGGRLGTTSIYYFYNCPTDYLYYDPQHLTAKPIVDILACLRSQHAAALIFSDAGAARGGFSSERIELTAAFLERLKQRVRYIAWLNPMPRSRWLGTTAGEIARLVPMFEFSRQGLERAIGVLRGQSMHYRGRIP